MDMGDWMRSDAPKTGKLLMLIRNTNFFNYLSTKDLSCSPPRILGVLGFTFLNTFSGETSFLVFPEGMSVGDTKMDPTGSFQRPMGYFF